jgi:heptosyltransferase-1
MTELLVIKPSSVGDIVHGLQVVQSIKDQAPSTRVTWVVRDRFAALVESCATVDEFLVFRRDDGPSAFVDLLRQIRRKRYDCVLDLQGLARSGLMTAAARAARKIGRGDAREGAGLFYRERAPLPRSGREAHAVEILLEFLPLLGLKPVTGTPLRYAPLDLATIDPQLGQEPTIVLCPHSRRAEKEWSGFRELARQLARERPDRVIVWTSDRTDAAGPTGSSFVDLSGRTSLAQLVALISSADLVVANDSGPIHIAAALGRPVVTLFGPTSARRYGPYPVDSPDHHVVLAPDGDLSRLDVQTVLNEVMMALAPAQ